MQNNQKIIAGFGLGGFLGKHLMRQLTKLDYRVKVATRNPYLKGYLKLLGNPGQIELFKTDIFNPEDIKKSIKHDPIEERRYWMVRMAKQAAMDIISYGRIGSGKLDSILLMDERDQLECLKGALEFAGKLNGTIDQANKELEIKYKGADLTLENLRMPALLDQIDDNEQKNIQHTPESKTDGISI